MLYDPKIILYRYHYTLSMKKTDSKDDQELPYNCWKSQCSTFLFSALLQKFKLCTVSLLFKANHKQWCHQFPKAKFCSAFSTLHLNLWNQVNTTSCSVAYSLWRVTLVIPETVSSRPKTPQPHCFPCRQDVQWLPIESSGKDLPSILFHFSFCVPWDHSRFDLFCPIYDAFQQEMFFREIFKKQPVKSDAKHFWAPLFNHYQTSFSVIEIHDSSNECEEEARPGAPMEEKSFISGLHSFMKVRGTPIERIPHLGFKQSELKFDHHINIKIHFYKNSSYLHSQSTFGGSTRLLRNLGAMIQWVHVLSHCLYKGHNCWVDN